MLFTGVNIIIQPGERVGIVGPNGAGKTTLLRTLLGELPPAAGSVVLGPRTKVAYFDQQRITLDEDATVAENAWHDEWVQLGGKKVRLADYLEDLLFPVLMQRQKVKALSGGERNRLLLAKLFLEGANVLVLDEPTNDLDLVTLNVLERQLVQFTGAVLVVTHDRYFLDKVATSVLAVEGDGKVTRYEGNWSMYQRLRPPRAWMEVAKPAAAPKARAGCSPRAAEEGRPALVQGPARARRHGGGHRSGRDEEERAGDEAGRPGRLHPRQRSGHALRRAGRDRERGRAPLRPLAGAAVAAGLTARAGG